MVSIRVLFGVYIQCTISYHLSYSVVAGRQRISDGNIFLGSVGHVCEYAQSFYTVCFLAWNPDTNIERLPPVQMYLLTEAKLSITITSVLGKDVSHTG